MFLMRDGSLVLVCGSGKAKVDSSGFMVSEGGIVQKGERLFLMRNRYSSPTCTVFLLGSSGGGSLSCVLATSYASGVKYFIVGKEKEEMSAVQ